MNRTGGRLTAAAVLVVGVLVTGCSGNDPGDPDEPETEPSGSSSSASPSPSVTTPVAGSSTYLPVPTGVRLTPQGTDLRIDQSAVVAWEPRQELVGVLDVKVTRLELTSFKKSFQGWQLDDEARKSTPYFVSATVANVGRSDVGGRDIPLYAVSGANDLIEASSFQTKFEPCPGNGVFPEKFQPGAKQDVCLVYLVPKHGELTAMSFRPIQQFDPITWTGPIKDLTAPPKKKGQQE